MKTPKSLLFVSAFTLALFANIQKENRLFADQDFFVINIFQESIATLSIDNIFSTNPGFHSLPGNNLLRRRVTATEIVQSGYSHAPLTMGTFRLNLTTNVETSYKVVADCGIANTYLDYMVTTGVDQGKFKLLSTSRTEQGKLHDPKSRDFLIISMYSDQDPSGVPGVYEFQDMQTIINQASTQNTPTTSRIITVKIDGNQLYHVRTGVQYSAFIKFTIINS